MRKIRSYIAVSLNGMIAKADGDVSWLDEIPNPEQSDYDYNQFYSEVDATIQGYNTFKHILDLGFDNPYPQTNNYVFTRKTEHAQATGFQFIREDHIAFTKNLKQQEGKDIWLIGGGQLNSFFLKAGLLDELMVFVMPVIIPDGIKLFENMSEERSLKLLESKEYGSGVVCLKYEFIESK